MHPLYIQTYSHRHIKPIHSLTALMSRMYFKRYEKKKPTRIQNQFCFCFFIFGFILYILYTIRWICVAVTCATKLHRIDIIKLSDNVANCIYTYSFLLLKVVFLFPFISIFSCVELYSCSIEQTKECCNSIFFIVRLA